MQFNTARDYGGLMVQQEAPFHLLETTIDAVHGAFRSGRLTCRQLVQLYLDRINAYDQQGPTLNAIQTVNQAALREADELDARFRASGPVGPLHGIPVAVKDQVETNDMPTTYGSALFRGYVSERDATVVERLRAAGAIVLAKTNMGEFAAGYLGSAFGTSRNPYDPARDPSGSSSGTGVAVAANFATLGIGEDTLGSIRGPASRGSLVGLRPTVPLVSRFGMMPATPSRDTLGPIARTVRDAARLLDVIAGYDPNDPVTAASVGHVPETYTSFLVADGFRGMRLGVIREPLATDTDTNAEDFRQIRAAIDQALKDLTAGGAEIVDPVVIPSLPDLLSRTTGTFETEAAINAYLAALPNAPVRTYQDIVLSPDVMPSRKARLLEGVGHTTHDLGYLEQMVAREELRQTVLKAMADHHIDALVYATFDHEPAIIPPDFMTVKTVSQRGNNRTLAPMLSYPAISVPAGYMANGVPVGIEFLGRPFTEGLLIQIAYGYEQATRHRQPPKTTPALPGEP
jgi:Asp-tRNA(Asn)/Glu-tRNA(Gln) amidotransferase A subunit family amidase